MGGRRLARPDPTIDAILELVTSGITQRVLLIGPDDDARRALHLLLDRLGHEVAAADDLDAARRHLVSERADVAVAAAELAGAAALDSATPPVIAVVRSRDLALSTSLLAAGGVRNPRQPVA